MREIYYDSTGKQVPAGNSKVRVVVEQASQFEYGLREKTKRGWRKVAYGNVEQCAAAFKRITGKELDLGDCYYNANRKPCSKEKAIWVVHGNNVSCRTAWGWAVWPEVDDVRFWYYTVDGERTDDSEQAAEVMAVLPMAGRCQLDKDGGYIKAIEGEHLSLGAYFSREGQPCNGRSAYYRVTEDSSGMLAVECKKLGKWARVGEIPGFHIKGELTWLAAEASNTENEAQSLKSEETSCEVTEETSDEATGATAGATEIFEHTPKGTNIRVVEMNIANAKKMPKYKIATTPKTKSETSEKLEAASEIANETQEKTSELEVEEKAPEAEEKAPEAWLEEPELQLEDFDFDLDDNEDFCTASDKPGTASVGIIEQVWRLIEGNTYLKKENLGAYLYLCMWRNRACEGGSIFNSRLTDIVGQDIYLVDNSYKPGGVNRSTKISVSSLKVVMSLSEAQQIRPNFRFMPEPLQWSKSPSDYCWNPTMKVQPVNSGNLRHICLERRDRLPKELQKLEPAVLLQAIKQSVDDGAHRACRDVRYALPCYSREHNEISMMLPIKVPTIYGDKAVAAAILVKNLLGYSLATVITLEQARRSVGLFTDPNMTWCREEQ